jgi:hypothetical protein
MLLHYRTAVWPKPSIPLLPECISSGEVSLLLVLEDLLNENSIQLYDLAGHAKYKEHFANESYQEAFVYLFRRRAYPLLASGI